jgi:hypothetical protein
VQQSVEEIRAIVEAIEARDGEAAAEAASNHVRQARGCCSEAMLAPILRRKDSFDILPGPRHLGFLPFGFLALARASYAPVGAPLLVVPRTWGLPWVPTTGPEPVYVAQATPNIAFKGWESTPATSGTGFTCGPSPHNRQPMVLVKVPSLGSTNHGDRQVWAKAAGALALVPGPRPLGLRA